MLLFSPIHSSRALISAHLTRLSASTPRSSSLAAVLLTHEHADAILGLDDLTQWSKHIQGHVDVYCDERTLKAIKEKFP